MSEVKLNIIDSRNIFTGTIHGSVADSCVAALSAEPETIAELSEALNRYIKPEEGHKPFAFFHRRSEVDSQPWDAGLVIIDLAARIVTSESSYSQPQPEGEVRYHNGNHATDIGVMYRVPPDWLFVNSVEAYRWSCERRRQQREERPPLDARAVLYGRPLIEFIVDSGIHELDPAPDARVENTDEASARRVSNIHASWLTTPRNDLRGRSPREVLLEKQDFIDFDMHTRCLQWTFQGEGPPCLPPGSFGYRFAGFGTHEWVVYYYLVRHLLWSASSEVPSLSRLDSGSDSAHQFREALIGRLEQLKSDWLEQPQDEFDGKLPAIIIENERKRLPQAMTAAEIIIDEDCHICRMSALESEMGFGPTFWHLDGYNMDDEFAFSSCLTTEAWEAALRRREDFAQESARIWAEHDQLLAHGEIVEDGFGFDWLEKPESEQSNPDPDYPF